MPEDVLDLLNVAVVQYKMIHHVFLFIGSKSNLPWGNQFFKMYMGLRLILFEEWVMTISFCFHNPASISAAPYASDIAQSVKQQALNPEDL